MVKIEPFTLEQYLNGFRDRRIAGTLSDREAQVIDRLTDAELPVTDIRSVLWCLWFQHDSTPIGEVPEDWWCAVVAGARMDVDGRMTV